MSIIVKETGKTLRSYDTSTTFEVIDRAIGIGMNSLAIVQVNDEEISNIRRSETSYGNGFRINSVPHGYEKKLCGFYLVGEDTFPLVLSDPYEEMPGYFDINIGAIVYYPNRILPEEERISRLHRSDYTIYTTETFENILKEYSEKRKCFIVREYPSENKPTILTGKTEQLESVEFMRQITRGRAIK